MQRLGSSFSLVGRDSLEYQRDLGTEDVSDVLRMTPNSWHLSDAAVTAAGRVGRIRLTIGFDVLRFQKTPPAPSAA